METLSHVNASFEWKAVEIITNKINIYCFLLFTFTGYLLLLGGLELSGLRVVLDDRKTGACTCM